MSTRPSAVAGLFYPADPDELRLAVRDSFARAVRPADDEAVPKAVVVPHAGFVYSGPIAASAYLRVAPAHATIRRVVVLGPSHRVYLDGMAVPSVDDFDTPFGPMPIDRAARTAARAVPAVTVDDRPHRLEHSLEVQLPFLMTVLDEFAVLPVAVGEASTHEVAALLDAVWGGDETLVVISTDLSHYRPYDEARALDSRTAAAVLRADAGAIGDHDACGSRPLRGLLATAAERRLRIEQLDLRNSGDTAGDRARVVGYGAFAVV